MIISRDDETAITSIVQHHIEQYQQQEVEKNDMDALPVSSRNFPYKLFQLLEDASEKGNEDIVSWLPHGKAFKVYNQDLFEAQIMKKYFRQSKYRSFVRQLYHYHFGRIDYGADKGAYFHPNFQRSNKSLAIAVSRIPPTINFRHSLLAQTQSSITPQLAIAASGTETRSEKKLTIDGLLKRDQTSRKTMMEGRSVVTKKHEPSSKKYNT